jgi:hypothetical protein
MIPAGKPYDPEWVLQLARDQRPYDAQLLRGLKACTRVIGTCQCGCGDPYFVDPASKEWVHKRCVELVRGDGVSIIVDVLADGRVGHIEIGEWGEKK